MDTIYTKNAPDAIGPYSQAVRIGDMLYTSGQIAINPATGNVEAADIVGQSKQGKPESRSGSRRHQLRQGCQDHLLPQGRGTGFRCIQ